MKPNYPKIALALTASVFASTATAQEKTPPAPKDTPAPSETEPGRAPGGRQPGTEPGTERNGDGTGKHEPAPAPTSEADFVQKAAKGGMSEVKLAKLATTKAEDAKLKEFATTLVKDHTAANEQLKEAAKEANHTISETPDPKAEAKYTKLSKLEGKSFDDAFLDEMGMCHEKSIALFEAGKKVVKSEGVSTFIEKTLPVIERHAATIGKMDPERENRSKAPRRGEEPGGPEINPGPATEPAAPPDVPKTLTPDKERPRTTPPQ